MSRHRKALDFLTSIPFRSHLSVTATEPSSPLVSKPASAVTLLDLPPSPKPPTVITPRELPNLSVSPGIAANRTSFDFSACEHSVFLSFSDYVPFAMFSVIPYVAEHDEGKKQVAEQPEVYDPYYLDDPEIRTGKHRTVMNLESFMFSIIPFVRPKELKDELNEQFRVKHDWLTDQSLTLSKLRNLKILLLEIGIEMSVNFSTVALSYVFLEKLTLLNHVNKSNRKLVGAGCLVLATKMNDNTHFLFAPLLEEFRNRLNLDRKQIWQMEFFVFSNLSFELHVPLSEVFPHYKRIAEYCEERAMPCDPWPEVEAERVLAKE